MAHEVTEQEYEEACALIRKVGRTIIDAQGEGITERSLYETVRNKVSWVGMTSILRVLEKSGCIERRDGIVTWKKTVDILA